MLVRNCILRIFIGMLVSQCHTMFFKHENTQPVWLDRAAMMLAERMAGIINEVAK